MSKKNKIDSDELLDDKRYLTSARYFQKELDEMDGHVAKGEELYGDVHDLFKKLTGGKGGMVRSVRDIAELAKSLSSIRSTNVEATNKKMNTKRVVGDLAYKLLQMEKNDQMAEESVSAIMRELNKKMSDDKNKQNISDNLVSPIKSDDEDKLESTLNQAITSGKLQINNNEKGMKYDFNGVNYAYDKSNNSVIALDKDGNHIKDYPTDRLPKVGDVRNMDNGMAIMENGELPIYQEENDNE